MDELETKGMTDNVWHQDAKLYWPGTTALNIKNLPPAIYRFGATPSGWYLEKTADRYTFPYKIYGTNDDILSRIKRAWHGLPSNFGVLLNGLKGTGKTITAQQLVNWAIDDGFIVLNVQYPIPLADVMAHIEQPMLVLFDEFEKTHDDAANPGSQQQLLSAIDGLSRNDHRRLFLFTTNTKKVNDNLIDRPSRIRYCWEFTRVSNELIEMLLDDLLDKGLSHLRPEIMNYFNTRAVLTIDVVKTVIIECNIFREGPENFKLFMNLTEKEPGAFKIDIIDELGVDADIEVSSWFKCNNGAWLSSIMTKSGREAFIEGYCAQNRTHAIQSYLGQRIELIGPTDKDNEWTAYVQVPPFKSWVGLNVERSSERFLWMDECPEDWKVPGWARKIEAGTKLTNKEHSEFSDWVCSGTVYGSGVKKKVEIRFTLNNEPYSYSFSSSD